MVLRVPDLVPPGAGVFDWSRSRDFGPARVSAPVSAPAPVSALVPTPVLGVKVAHRIFKNLLYALNKPQFCNSS